MPVYFLQFEANVAPDHPEATEIGGALINCWIQSATLAEAIDVARGWLSEDRWIIDEPEEAREVDENFYAGNAAGRMYYRRALIDGAVIVAHRYPIDEEPHADHERH